MSTPASVLGVLGKLSPTLDTKIQDMRAAQKNMKLEKKRLAKDLRNAEKRRRRLRTRARELPAEDLLEVLAMRQVRDAETAAATSQD